MKRTYSFGSLISWVGAGLAAIWLLAACTRSTQGVGSPGTPRMTPEDQVTPAAELESTPTRMLGSPELHATGPGSVSLASGDVQLVEFFAFW